MLIALCDILAVNLRDISLFMQCCKLLHRGLWSSVFLPVTTDSLLLVTGNFKRRENCARSFQRLTDNVLCCDCSVSVCVCDSNDSLSICIQCCDIALDFAQRLQRSTGRSSVHPGSRLRTRDRDERSNAHTVS